MHLSYLILTQVFATLFLTGLIWTIQMVHYPSFLDLGADEFLKFHSHHSERISLIVIPMMTLELVIAVVMLFASVFEQLESNLGSNADLLENQLSFIRSMGWLIWFNMILVLIIWLVTFFVSVPLHNRLGQGFDESTIRSLIHSNWFRTILWSVKSYVVLKILVLFYKHPQVG